MIVGVPSLVLTVIGDGGTHVMTLLQLVAWLIVIGAAEIILSVSLAGLIVPGSRHRLNAHLLLILCVTSYACAALLIFRSSPGPFEPHTGARCFAVGCATAAVAGILLVYVTRKGVVLSWPQTGASTGLLAGMVGASVLLFHCKTAEMIHVVVWHTGVLLFCTLMGAVAGMGPAISPETKPHSLPTGNPEAGFPSQPDPGTTVTVCLHGAKYSATNVPLRKRSRRGLFQRKPFVQFERATFARCFLTYSITFPKAAKVPPVVPEWD